MSHFTSDFNQFFIELAANNHKDWFDQNRKWYEKEIKKPFENFMADLLAALKKDDPALDMDPKKTIFRINRDIRFSKDKSPYKLNRSAAFSPGGGKDGSHAGLYLQFGPELITIGGGAYQPDKEQLRSIREKIMESEKQFKAAIEDPNFVETYGELKGEKNKRLPPEFAAAAVGQPYLFNKQFYYMADFPPELITDDLLLDFVIEKYHDASKFRSFLNEALIS